MEALSLDVKCYESFEALVGGNMLSLDEGKGRYLAFVTPDAELRTEWNFVQTLAYREQTKEEADFVRMMYTVRLKKVRF
jgi:anaphase-promoting complex subunit 6